MLKAFTLRCVIGVAAILFLGVSCGPGEIARLEGEPEASAPAAQSARSSPKEDASISGYDASAGIEGSAGTDATAPTPLTTSAEGLAVLEELRTRFTVLSAPALPESSDDESSEELDAAVRAPVMTTPLAAGIADGFDIGASGVRPHFPASAKEPTAHISLGRKATAPFRVEDAATGTAIEVSLRHTRDVSAEAAAGYLVYRQAHESGATILHRALSEGTEEFLSFEAQPSSQELTYDVTFLKGVSGLRLVANTLEMLDRNGAPRLRVAPPSLLGADGSTIEATLAVDNCAFDTDPAPPWDRPVVAPGADTCPVRVVWPGEGVAYPALLDPKWSDTTVMIAARQGHTSTLLSTGKVLVTGGIGSSGSALSSIEVYNPAAQPPSWATGTAMPGAGGTGTSPRSRHTATQMGTTSSSTTSGKVLIAGGLNGTTSVNTALLYNPTDGSWVNAGNLNVARHYHTATLLAGSSNARVLIAGGMTNTTVLNSAAVYNPTSGAGTWTATPVMGTTRRYHTATLLTSTNATYNNKVLVVGGNSGGTTSTTSVQTFDGTSWATPSGIALATAREQHTATLMSDGKLLIVGGRNGTAAPYTSAFFFNPAVSSGNWSSAGTLTTGRYLHTATRLSTSILNNGLVVVAGGSTNGTASLSSFELFNGTTWSTPTQTLVRPTREHVAQLLNNGLVLIAGGIQTSAAINNAEVYDPSSALSCTSASQCASGFCANGVCCNAACTGDCEACNQTGSVGTCTPKPNLTACTDDLNPCTLDRCNGSATTCQHPAGNAGATCRASTGLCDPAETCSGSSTTCPTDAKAAVGTPCPDGNACNGAETCGAGGVCLPGTPVNPSDNNPCTDDICNPANGAITHPNFPAGTPCPDGNACNGAELCNSNGACLQGTPIPTDDGNLCTTDTCNTVTGEVTHTPVAAGTSCSDGNACNGEETCDQNAACASGTPPTVTDDGNPCTTDTCDPVLGVVHPPVAAGTSCSDDNACNGEETCNANGVCVAGTPISCHAPIVFSAEEVVSLGATALAVSPGATRVYVGSGYSDRSAEHLAVVSLDTNGQMVGRPSFYPQAASSVTYNPDAITYITDIVVDWELRRLYVGWAHHWSNPLSDNFLTVYTLDTEGNISGEPRSYPCTTTAAGPCTQGIYSLALHRPSRTLYAGGNTAYGGAIIAYRLDASAEPTVRLGEAFRGNDGTIAQLAVTATGDKLYAAGSGAGLMAFELDAQGTVGQLVFHQNTDFPTSANDFFLRFVYTPKAIYRRPWGYSDLTGVSSPVPLTFWPLDSQGVPVSSGWIATEHPPVVDIAAASGNLVVANILQLPDALSGAPANVGADVKTYSVDAQGRPSAAPISALSVIGQTPIQAATSADQYPVVVTRRTPTSLNLTSNYHLRISVQNVAQSTCPNAFTLNTINGDVATGPFTWNAASSKCESAWLPLDTVFGASNPLAGQSGQLLFNVAVNAPFPNPTTFQIEVARGAPTAGGTILATLSDPVTSITTENRMHFLLPGYAYTGDQAAAIKTLTHQAEEQAAWANAVAVPTNIRPSQFTISAYSLLGRQGSASYLGFMADTLARLGINTIGFTYWDELGSSVVANALNERGIVNGLAVNPWGPGSQSPGTFDFQCDSTCINTWADALAQQIQAQGIPASALRELPLQWGPGWQFPDVLELVTSNPAYLASYRQYMQAHGFSSTVTPIGRASALDSAPVTQRQQFYWTTKFFEQAWANEQKAVAEAIRARFPQVFEHAAPLVEHGSSVLIPETYRQFDGAWPGDRPYTADAAVGRPSWFLSGRMRALGLSSPDWTADTDAEVAAYNADILRSASALGDGRLGAYIGGKYTGDHPEGFSYRALSFVGRGAKVLDLYTFGPRVLWPASDAWSDKQAAYGPIAKAMRRIGAAESALYPGLPERSKVAVQLAGADHLWDVIPDPFPSCNGACLAPKTTITQHESRGLHTALTHQGYSVDFVDETDLATPDLLENRGYQVVYLTQLNISTAAQQEIANWVSSGGTVVATAGAGLWDEYNTRSTGGTETLLGVLGLNPPPAAGSWTHLRDASPFTTSFNYSGFVNSSARNPSGVDLYANMTQESPSYPIPSGLVRMFAASLSPIDTADIVTQFSGPGAEGPAVTAHPYGSGTAIAYGFLPGTEYLISQDRKAINRLPSDWDSVARTRAVAPVLNVNPRRNVYTSVPGVEALRLNSPTIAIVLLNWTDQPLSSVTVHVAGAANLPVTSVEGALITTANAGADLDVTLPINAVDILTIRCNDFCNPNGACGAPPPVIDDGNPCTTDTCDLVSGVKHVRASAGTSCSDGNACNGAETCNANGVCTAGTPVTCSASDACHLPGTCDAGTGVCSNPPAPPGTSCSDGNPCNGAETCNASGVCTAGTPVNCAADQCRLAGTCDPATGLCSNLKPDGLQCNDADACTRTDVCAAGVCTGTIVPGCATKISVEDLGVLTGGTESGAYSINDSGVTTGYSFDSGEVYRIVRWTPGSPIELIGPGYPGSGGGINSAGVFAGTVFGGPAFRYSDAAGFLFLSPSGVQEFGVAINESNSVAGFSGSQAFRYTAAQGHQFLGILPGGNQSYAYAIDDQDNVVGWSTVATTPPGNQWLPGHAFRYISAQGQLQDLNQFAPIGWELRTAKGINGDEIVGFAGHELVTQAYRLTLSTGRVDDLGTFNGGGISYALSMNRNGAVVGAAYLDASGSGNFRATVFTEQLGPVNLDSATDPAQGWLLAEANALNNNGDVVGWGFHNGNRRAFRMHVPGLNPARVPRCQNNAQCATGFCSPQGVCCDTACTSVCSSCMLPGKVGTCSTRPVGARCSAASICDGGGDICDASGACVPGSGPPDVNDNNPCTADSCDPSTGAKHVPTPGVSCSDGNACNGAETCDTNGQCAAGTPVICGFPDACHLPGTCDPATGVCLYPPAAPDTRCGDTNDCNGIEMCDGAGNCVTSGGPPDTNDDNPCTVDGCDDTTGLPTHTPLDPGSPCDSLCLTGGTGTCNPSHTCVGSTAVTCTALDQCHAVGTCSPSTGVCSDPALPDGTACDDGVSCTQGDTCQGGSCGGDRTTSACTPECPCGPGTTCTDDSQCGEDLICNAYNGRYFGKDPLTSNCWSPICPVNPQALGASTFQDACGKWPPTPRTCSSDADCQSTNEVCGQGNGSAFGLGNVNVCWPPVCDGRTLCGSPQAPCGNCACATICSGKTCDTADKRDGCSGYCAGLCGDGQIGCDSDVDCRGSSICFNRVCVPPSCLALDPTRGCDGSNPACPTCPVCTPQCDGRSCGPDPAGCVASCGEECGSGSICANGQCVPSTDTPPTVVDSVDVGAVDGSFSVSAEGEAQYSIPIAVPPGRQGRQPDIGLVYSSDKRLGPAGMGWRVTGFSSIIRCPRTIAQDGAPGPVRYDDKDRFCLDGKRLVRVPSDGPAEVGAVYHTEVDDFSKIVVVDVLPDHTGPLSFKVYTKAGTILTYGGTEDSSVYHRAGWTGADARIKRVWGVSSVEDRNGNFIHYSYQTRSTALSSLYNPGGPMIGDGFEMVPKEVSYGSNPGAGLPDDRSVQFVYVDTPLRAAQFVNGSASLSKQRLTQIQTYVRSGLVRRYELIPEDKGFVPRLKELHECAPGATREICKQPTKFVYDDDPVFGPPEPQTLRVNLLNWTGHAADVTGTGTDAWWVTGNLFTNGNPSGGPVGSTIDLNNDGHESIVSEIATANSIFITSQVAGAWVKNEYTFTFTSPDWQAPGVHSDVKVADIDGDGFKDIVVCRGHGLAYWKGHPTTSRDLGVLTELRNPWGVCGMSKMLLVDVDGDGVVNLLRQQEIPTLPDPQGDDFPPPRPIYLPWKALVFPSTGSGEPTWVDVKLPQDFSEWDPHSFLTLDANGDGLTDILTQTYDPARVEGYYVLLLNRGDFTFQRVSGADTTRGSLIYDADGDGNDDVLTDLAWYRWRPGQLLPNVQTTTADAPFVHFRSDDNARATPFLADVDGDGDFDLIEMDTTLSHCNVKITDPGERAACPPQIRKGHSRRMHLLKQVVDGLGRQIDIVYNGKASQDNLNACQGRADILCPRKFHPLVGEHSFRTLEPTTQGTSTVLRKVFRYGYANARAGINGRGSFGFGRVTTTEFDGDKNPDSAPPFSVTSATYYNEDFVRAGLLQERSVTSGEEDGVSGLVQNAKHVVTENLTYNELGFSGRTTFPVLVESTKRTIDRIGATDQVVSTEITTLPTSAYDEYGNCGNQVRRTSQGASATPVSVVETSRHFKAPDVDNWIVGLVEDETINSTHAGAPANPGGARTWHFDYDTSGRLWKRTRAPGNTDFELVETFEYPAPPYNLQQYTIQPDSAEPRFTLFSYDSTGTFPQIVTNSLGHQRISHFDPRHGGVFQTFDANGIEEDRTYDGLGRLTEVRGPQGHVLIALHGRTDALDTPVADGAVYRVLTQELPRADGQPAGVMIEDIGVRGEILKRDVTGYVKDGNDQWVEETFKYDVAGRLQWQTRPHLLDLAHPEQISDQGRVSFFYDKFGALAKELYPDGSSVLHIRASRNTWLGEISVFSGLGFPVALDMVTKRDDGAVDYTTASMRAFDPDGLVVTARDAKRTLSDYTYGPYNQLLSVQASRASEGPTTEIVYDTYGRKTYHSDPDSGIESYFYTPFDEVRNVTDARGIAHVYGYDRLGRLTNSSSETDSNSPVLDTTTWKYDGVEGDPRSNERGRLVRVSYGPPSEPDRHTTRYNYQPDGFGLLESVDRKIAAETFTTRFEYDDFLRVNVVHYPNGVGSTVKVGRAYDQRGNLTGIVDADSPSTPYWSVTDTDQGYRVAEEEYGNHVKSHFEYDSVTGRLIGILSGVTVNNAPLALQDFVYHYKPNGNLDIRTNNLQSKTENFAYDELDRLTDMSIGTVATHLANYDERGNIQFKAGVGSYVYDSSVAPLHAPQTAGARTFTYDPAGNEVHRTGGPEGDRITTYTPFNLPDSISDSATSNSTTFEYDGDHTRVLKMANGIQQTLYAGNLYERVVDLVPDGQIATHKYRIFAAGKQVAQLERKETSPTTYEQKLLYLHGDHLGSTQLVTDGDGGVSSAIVLAEQTFDPWGKPEGPAAWEGGGPTANVHTGFTGHEHDPEHGLINMRGRIYDPDLGRFTTPDPFVQSPFYSQSLNRYAYVFNNPLRYTDPSGFVTDPDPIPPSGPAPAEPDKKREGAKGSQKKTTPTQGDSTPQGAATGAAPKADTTATSTPNPGAQPSAQDTAPGGNPEKTKKVPVNGGEEKKESPGAADDAARAGNAEWQGNGDTQPRSAPGAAPQGDGSGGGGPSASPYRETGQLSGGGGYPIPNDSLSPETQGRLAPFFPNFDLRKIRIHIGLPWPVQIGINPRRKAITFGNDIYFRDAGAFDTNTARGLGAIGHEITHSEQYEALGGVLNFISAYVAEYNYLRGLGYDQEKAYRNISFEVISFAKQDAITKTLRASGVPP